MRFPTLASSNKQLVRLRTASSVTENIIEHHSSRRSRTKAQETTRLRLACENWDAPLVVTTNVQLFESLFAANRPRAAASCTTSVDSVIVLDEAQLPAAGIPATHPRCPQSAGRGITASTAGVVHRHPSRRWPAEPILIRPARIRRGFKDKVTRDRRRSLRAFTADLKLVRVHLVCRIWTRCERAGTKWRSEIDRHEDCVLAIVATRGDARKLSRRLMPHGNYGIYPALMCGEHRSAKVFDEIKAAAQSQTQKALSVQ
jgi:CRISPR-associated endonuclease/helicase Cas3